MGQMSPGACLQAARRLEAEFRGTYVRWEVAGEVRREQPSDRIVHLITPKAPRGQVHDQAVWERVSELVGQHAIDLWPGSDGTAALPEVEHRVCSIDFHGVRHDLHLATPANFAPRLALLTGPDGYTRMLLHRLQLAGALRLDHGVVVSIDRSKEPPRLETVPCNDERMFFRLCRTSYKHPKYRFARPEGIPDDRVNWERGMLEPWYPAGVKVYADPRQTWLFDSSKLVRKPPRDWRAWQHR